MRGCSNYCSYCVVPGARGKEKSREIGEILDEVRKLVERGVKEVTLLGQNITGYGRTNGRDLNLVKLLSEVNRIEGLWRIRFITSHPRDVEPELFYAMRDLEKVAEYLHLPLQAGSDRILKLMNRGYTLSRYMEIVEELRNILPEISLGTDFIVGFPGESDEDFRKTLKVAEEIGFDMAYMYKYSQRPGTKAFSMEGQVMEDIIRERHQQLLKLQEKISLRKNQALIGKDAEVLVEGRSKRNKERVAGRDRGNRMVVFEGSDDLIGKMVSVPIIGATGLTLYGETYRKGVKGGKKMAGRKPFTIDEAKRIGEKLGIKWDKFDAEQFRMGMDVELEHGWRDPSTNVTNDNDLITGKIALAHLKEFSDYYTRLEKLEKEAEEYWAG